MKRLLILLVMILTASLTYAQDIITGTPYNPKKETIYSTAGLKVKPEYPGGTQALIKYFHSKFDKTKVKNQSKRTVRLFVSFVIEKNGSVSEVKISNPADEDINSQVIKILKLQPNWKPGSKEGKTIRARFTLPLTIDFTE